MINNEELIKEKAYLKNVLEILNKEIGGYKEKVSSLSNNIQEQMTYAWDKTNRLSDTEFVYALANIQKRSVYAENANKKLKAYSKMLSSAYFARIDFDDGEEILPIYIGIASLQSGDDFYVFDWRAPISSMFYNSEVGDASYNISSGETIKGKITLKRQYKIEGDKIVEIFDTDMQIIDNILKVMLSSNSSSKMKNIVNTIQKEQNEVIRKNDVDLLVVEGPAGCGKTSIAMHKIAYLLYSKRNEINSSNVMILSPNEIFNNYISEVLPGIGEDNVCEATFFEFAKAYIDEFEIASKIEDVLELVYSYNKDKNKFAELKFKLSPIYIKILRDYIKENESEILGIDSILIDDKEIVSKFEVADVIKNIHSINESLYLKGKNVIERIFTIASGRTERKITLEKLKKDAIDAFVKIKTRIAKIYEDFYRDESQFVNFVKSELGKYGKHDEFSDEELKFIYSETKKNLDNGKLEYQDVTAFMYVKSKIVGIGANKNIKYVLIDEAQDYSVSQYKIISKLFKNANIILLGDVNQCILPFNEAKDFSKIKDALLKSKQNSTFENVMLEKTYRSTFEINEFAKKILSINNEYTQVERHGEPVEIVKQDKFLPEQIILDAKNLKNSYNTVAIICKNQEETLLYKEIIELPENKNKFVIVSKNDNVFLSDKIMIIPSYLAKGLEFDAVVVSNASNENYFENELNLLYVVLTRALHKLKIYYSGEIAQMLKIEG